MSKAYCVCRKPYNGMAMLQCDSDSSAALTVKSANVANMWGNTTLDRSESWVGIVS